MLRFCRFYLSILIFILRTVDARRCIYLHICIQPCQDPALEIERERLQLSSGIKPQDRGGCPGGPGPVHRLMLLLLLLPRRRLRRRYY